MFRNIKTFIVGLCLPKNKKELSNYFDKDRPTLHTVYTYYIYATTHQALQHTSLKNLPPVGGEADTIYRHSKKVKPTQ